MININLENSFTTAGSSSAIAIDSGDNVWVINAYLSTNALQKFDNNGNLLGSFTTAGSSSAIAIDSADNIWITNGTSTNDLQKFDNNGNLLGSFTTEARGDSLGLAIDSGDNVWIVFQIGLQQFNNAGNSINVYSILSFAPISGYQFQVGTTYLKGLAIDSDDNLYPCATAKLYGSSDYFLLKFNKNGQIINTLNVTALNLQASKHSSIKINNNNLWYYTDITSGNNFYLFNTELILQNSYFLQQTFDAGGMAIDSNDDVIVAAPTTNNNLFAAINENGYFLGTYFNSQNGSYTTYDIAIDSNNSLFSTDFIGNLYKFNIQDTKNLTSTFHLNAVNYCECEV